MNALPLQFLILKRFRLADFFEVFNDDMPAGAEILIPAGANFRRDVLKILLFRFYSLGCPLISVIVAAGLVLLEYVGPFPVQGRTPLTEVPFFK